MKTALRTIEVIAATALLAFAGCHVGETRAERATRFERYRVALDAREHVTLERLEAKRCAVDERLLARETAARAPFEARRREIVDDAAVRYHALLGDRRAVDPAVSAEMNRRIVAAAAAFRDAEERAEAEVGPRERAAVRPYEARRRVFAERVDRKRAEIVAAFASKRRAVDAEIAR